MTDTSVAANLDEIRALLEVLPGPNLEAGAAAIQRQGELTKPTGSLGRLEELACWLATWQGRGQPRLERPHTAVFAGNHGVATQGVSAYPPDVTAQMVRNFIDGGAAVNQLCTVADADLRVYEMDLEHPTRDFTTAPAMDEAGCAQAMAYGMMAVEADVDLLALGEMGIANTTSAAALCMALFGGEAAQWVGRGTGIDDARLARKIEVVEQAIERHRPVLGDPLAALCCLGGQEIAAIAGAIIGARMAKVPVMLDGYACCAAAAVLEAAAPGALDHCQIAHLSAEPGHARLVEALDKVPLLDLGMRLGEASGATVAILLMKAAVACHNGMATFAEAGVSGRDGE